MGRKGVWGFPKRAQARTPGAIPGDNLAKCVRWFDARA